MEASFKKIFNGYVDALGDPEKVIRFKAEDGTDIGIFVTEYLEGDEEIITKLFFTIGAGNYVTSDSKKKIELSFHAQENADLPFSEIEVRLVELIKGFVKSKKKFLANEIIHGPFLPNYSGYTIIYDHLFEAIAYNDNSNSFDIPILRVFPLFSEEIYDLEKVSFYARRPILLEIDPGLSGLLQRNKYAFLTKNAVTKLWADILNWHKEKKTQLWSVIQRKKQNELDFYSLENLIEKDIPIDLKASWEIQNVRVYVSDYEYLDIEGVKYIVKPLNDYIWPKNLLPFARDSGGNTICVDLEKQKNEQIVLFEKSEGIIRINMYSFFNWLSAYRNDLKNGKYMVNEEGFLEEKI
ncbi:MAG: hypothetical protein DHS20C18_34820 [Saprospiraceae bacterium]|nr:MAG: hypothetical protein DHS20C18_34820 [Saprospiraceae bacterium]